ncbi:hypothetical protein ACFO9Q_19405 [Paenibacillus sp. GCM10023252]|uniref:hypothetical protein n=1 Tax=Paenibacillus sp. GCM10023252 TaxID=3252649 RepID=UPI00361F0282
MAVYTTGVITNTRAIGTAATNIVLSTHNLGGGSATVLVEVFGVPITTLTLTPLYITGFIIPPNSVDIRSFFIAGNVAYEVQISETSIFSEIVNSTYGIDEFGNLVTEQRVLQSEMTPIAALSVPL